MKIKVIALPFAGGSKFSFNSILGNKSNHIVLEYPGRGARIREPLISEINTLVDDLFPKVVNEIEDRSYEKYVIYGHSLGALVGYLVCSKIKDKGYRSPTKLIVSGYEGPLIKREINASQLPDDLFWNHIKKLGGIPQELEEYTELKQLYIQILKSDFKLLENYCPSKNIEELKLNIPIDVFYGEKENFKTNDVISWHNLSSEKVRIKQLSGDHFFIFKHKDFFKDYFNTIKLI